VARGLMTGVSRYGTTRLHASSKPSYNCPAVQEHIFIQQQPPSYALVYLVPSAGIWSAHRSCRCRFRRLQGQEGGPRTLHHPLANIRRLLRPQPYSRNSTRRSQEGRQRCTERVLVCSRLRLRRQFHSQLLRPSRREPDKCRWCRRGKVAERQRFLPVGRKDIQYRVRCLDRTALMPQH
jgi:hypothetical protein